MKKEGTQEGREKKTDGKKDSTEGREERRKRLEESTLEEEREYVRIKGIRERPVQCESSLHTRN